MKNVSITYHQGDAYENNNEILYHTKQTGTTMKITSTNSAVMVVGEKVCTLEGISTGTDFLLNITDIPKRSRN